MLSIFTGVAQPEWLLQAAGFRLDGICESDDKALSYLQDRFPDVPVATDSEALADDPESWGIPQEFFALRT